MIRSSAFNLYFYTLTLLAALVGIVLVPIPTPAPAARPAAWLRPGGPLGHALDRRHEGRGARPREPAQARARRCSPASTTAEVDGILLAADIPGIAFVAMQELFRMPVIGTILYRLQMIRVDTCGGGKEREHLAQYAKRAYESGRHIAIYPEGNLMAPGERERYRSGIYYLSRDLGLPVTPVATSVGLLWNRRDWRKKAGRAAIEFLPPIETGLDKETFMRRLEDAIEDGERPADRGVLRPALHAVQLVLRSQGQTTASPPSPINDPRAAPSRSPTRPSWRSRFSRSAVRIDFSSVRLVAMSRLMIDVVVLGPMAHLVGRLGHALGDDLWRILGARDQALLEVARRGRQDEHRHQVVAALLLELLRALPVDVEQHVAAGLERRLDRRARRAVVVVEHPAHARGTRRGRSCRGRSPCRRSGSRRRPSRPAASRAWCTRR